jgi:hypothetical protein
VSAFVGRVVAGSKEFKDLTAGKNVTLVNDATLVFVASVWSHHYTHYWVRLEVRGLLGGQPHRRLVLGREWVAGT